LYKPFYENGDTDQDDLNAPGFNRWYPWCSQYFQEVELQGRGASLSSFTAHNIRLSDGSQTFPEAGWFIADSPWMLSARKVIELLYPEGPAGRTIVDLGCLEGGYTVEFAKMGMVAVGVEVRARNFENCEIVRQDCELRNLTFARSNVWDFPSIGRFDVAFCCGILYHLKDPRRFIKLVGENVDHAVIINTHLALEGGGPLLSEMTEHEGMAGRWYSEYDPATITPEQLEAAKWTSWGNSRSFWPTQGALVQALYDEGFDLVFEQFDWLAPNIREKMAAPFYAEGRRMLVGVRSGRLGSRTPRDKL
jgi:SAM-dependent methyltransferase